MRSKLSEALILQDRSTDDTVHACIWWSSHQMPQLCVYLVLTPTVTKGVRGAEKKRCRQQHIHLDILPSQLLCYTMVNGLS